MVDVLDYSADVIVHGLKDKINNLKGEQLFELEKKIENFCWSVCKEEGLNFLKMKTSEFSADRAMIIVEISIRDMSKVIGILVSRDGFWEIEKSALMKWGNHEST